MNRLLVKKSGEQQPQQIAGDDRDAAFGRQIFPVQMIDAARFGVGRDEIVRKFGDGFHGKGITTNAPRQKG